METLLLGLVSDRELKLGMLSNLWNKISLSLQQKYVPVRLYVLSRFVK